MRTLTKDQCDEAKTLATTLVERARLDSSHLVSSVRFWLGIQMQQHCRDHPVDGQIDRVLADMIAGARELIGDP